MADEYKRINLLIGTQTELAAGQEEGMPGIVADSDYRLGVYAAGAWRLMALRGGSETFSALSISGLTNGTIPLVSTAGGLLGNSSLSEDATSIKCVKPVDVAGDVTSAGSFQVSSAAGSPARLRFQTAGVNRWSFYKEASEESGANEGSGLAITAWSDAGVIIDNPVIIVRAIGGQIWLNRPVVVAKQALQWSSELVTSGRYVKITDTTIGPSATAKASLLNGGVLAGGFAAVTDPAKRWNAVGAKSRTELLGLVSSSANQVLVFELYRNGVVSATLTAPARTYGTNTAWRLVIKQTVRVAGASGTVRVLMRFYATADSVNSAASCYQMDATLTGIDLAASHTWDVVCTIPNSASNQITCQDAEKIG